METYLTVGTNWRIGTTRLAHLSILTHLKTDLLEILVKICLGLGLITRALLRRKQRKFFKLYSIN